MLFLFMVHCINVVFDYTKLSSLPSTYESFPTHRNTLSRPLSHTRPNTQTRYTKHIEFPTMKTRASPWQRHSTSPFHCLF